MKTERGLTHWAKTHGPSFTWEVWKRAGQFVGLVAACLVVCYAILFTRFHLAKPNVAWNYTAEYNAEARKIAETDRAWPLYRSALVAMEPLSVVMDEIEESDPDASPSDLNFWDELLAAEPGDKYWQFILPHLDRNRQSIELTRQAAARPMLGFYYDDPDNAVMYGVSYGHIAVHEPDESENQGLFGITLEQLDLLRTLGRLLVFDTRRAAAESDGAEVVANLSALMAVSEHCGDAPPSLITQVIAINIFESVLEALDQILDRCPDVLEDDQLEMLSNQIAATFGGTITLTVEGERAFMKDALQRIYTDDGNGDGRLTPEGLRLIKECSYSNRSWLERNWGQEASVRIEGAMLSPAIAGRKEMLEKYDWLMGLAESQGSLPLWLQDYSDFKAGLKKLETPPLADVRYGPLLFLFPTTGSAFVASEIATQRRDATLVAIALELYRRHNGDWPDDLDSLVPDFLPAVPLDRFDGQPIRYRLTDGRPMIYSIGVDRLDDGGRPPSDPQGNAEEWCPQSQVEQIRNAKTNCGDWILWPPTDNNDPSALQREVDQPDQ